MEKKNDFERLRINRDISLVLCRNCVDLSKVNFSTSSNLVVYITGTLLKSDHNDFETKQLLSLYRELATVDRVREVQFSVDNWEVGNAGSYVKRLIRYS